MGEFRYWFTIYFKGGAEVDAGYKAGKLLTADDIDLIASAYLYLPGAERVEAMMPSDLGGMLKEWEREDWEALQ